ncbi:transposase, partial [Pseudomonas aeruginosa]|uniref:transposase n=1 Tax=Pseudomonas aeruginosa TaxID=287 RepID=UPI001F0938CD
MSKQRRTFSAEFKREAAALVLDQGYSHIDACRSLGVVDSALRRWVKQLEAERQGVTPKSKALTPEQQKIQELEARINRLEREKAILKKATALLIADSTPFGHSVHADSDTGSTIIRTGS